jgi:hypothetical protein
MGQALTFIPPDANFDPETAAMLGAVFDKVIASLRDGGQPEIVREANSKTHHHAGCERRAQS